jgi:hypothetical protein
LLRQRNKHQLCGAVVESDLALRDQERRQGNAGEFHADGATANVGSVFIAGKPFLQGPRINGRG